MQNTSLTGPLETLEELLEEVHADVVPLGDLMPTFGGPHPSSANDAWSWDERYVLAGMNQGDIEVITREEWERTVRLANEEGEAAAEAWLVRELEGTA